jgi:ribonuclease J
MNDNMRLASDMGLLQVPAGVWKDWDDLKHLDPRLSVVVSTGSQGEVNSGLSRMAAGKHSDIKVEPDDTLVYSARAIPGNERNIAHLINNFCRQGAEVVTQETAEIHVSGHGSREDLRQMLRLLRPQYLMPGHGELRHQVAHKKLAYDEGMEGSRVFVLENGQRLEYDGKTMKVGGKVPAGEVLVDGLSIGDEMEPVLRDRRHLNEGGMVVCVLGIKRGTGEVLSGPDLVEHGVFSGEDNALLEEAKDALRDALKERGLGLDWAEAGELCTVTLKRFFKRRLQRRPVILPSIMEL